MSLPEEVLARKRAEKKRSAEFGDGYLVCVENTLHPYESSFDGVSDINTAIEGAISAALELEPIEARINDDDGLIEKRIRQEVAKKHRVTVTGGVVYIEKYKGLSTILTSAAR
jgi:hypothetical protein